MMHIPWWKVVRQTGHSPVMTDFFPCLSSGPSQAKYPTDDGGIIREITRGILHYTIRRSRGRDQVCPPDSIDNSSTGNKSSDDPEEKGYPPGVIRSLSGDESSIMLMREQGWCLPRSQGSSWWCQPQRRRAGYYQREDNDIEFPIAVMTPEGTGDLILCVMGWCTSYRGAQGAVCLDGLLVSMLKVAPVGALPPS